MNHPEAVMLIRYVRAICPAQKFDEYTPDAWHDLLRNYSLADCREAARTVGQKQPFIAPAEIITEVRRIRDQRIDAANVAYDGQPDETAPEFTSNLRQLLRAAGDGKLGEQNTHQAIPDRKPPELEAGPQGRLQAALTAIGSTPPRQVPGVANPLATGCPHCAAPPGRACHTSIIHRRMADPHPARIERATRAAAGLDDDSEAS